MNSERAKKIPLALILEKLGCKPTRIRAKESTYSSPLRSERTPSFQVNHLNNVWFDHGIGRGGSIIDFACAYLESQNEACTISDALRWLETMSGTAPVIKSIAHTDFPKEDKNLILKKVQSLKHPALIKYLEGRGIPLAIASPYIVEVIVHNKESNKNFFALGFGNEEGGYELRNQFFKGTVDCKTISFIRGNRPKPDGIHIFEGFLDYVSALTFRKVARLNSDAIILNSLSCLKEATPYIQHYGYHAAYTWLDNDAAGKKGTASLADFFHAGNLRQIPMNAVYRPHKDVNVWLMHSLKL